MIKRAGAVLKNIVIVTSVIAIFSPFQALALDITKENVIDLTNRSRSEEGVLTLQEDSLLTIAAQAKAEDMINRQYWAHFYNGEKPWDWMKKAGYVYIDAGENLAIDFDKSEDMNKAWLESPSHRENLLNEKYTDIGVGIAEGWFKDHNTIVVVQMFGKPKNTNKVQSMEVQADQPTVVETEDITEPENQGWFANTLTWIGKQTINIWSNVQTTSQKSIAWLGSQILPGMYASAD